MVADLLVPVPAGEVALTLLLDRVVERAREPHRDGIRSWPDLLAVHPERREGIEAVTDEHDPVVAEQSLRYGEAAAVLPVALPDPVRVELLGAVEGVGDRTGGEQIDGTGYYYRPTVLGDVAPGTVAFEEEIFGPVLAVVRAAGGVFEVNRIAPGAAQASAPPPQPRPLQLDPEVHPVQLLEMET